MQFQNIKVGDIIEIADGQALPADCLLLKSTRTTGQVFVETSALDGERNLQPLHASLQIQNAFATIFDPDAKRSGLGEETISQNIEFSTIEPLKSLYTFNGSARI